MMVKKESFGLRVVVVQYASPHAAVGNKREIFRLSLTSLTSLAPSGGLSKYTGEKMEFNWNR